MEEPIILAEHLSKDFILFRRTHGFKGMLLHLPKYIQDRTKPHKRRVLIDVSLAIQKGETIGIAGANGCGKTTLLSIIGGVLKPTSGRVTTRGRISMMLALGAGFANDLSGRENIILNGVLQGIPYREMLRRSEQIIEFSGIDPEFIDSPIFQYSSGMKARLGFGVAIMTDPDILLVDEVLAVGDTDFQAKCLETIREKQRKGMTIVLVSHSAPQIESFCDRLLYINAGRVELAGPTPEVLAQIRREKRPF